MKNRIYLLLSFIFLLISSCQNEPFEIVTDKNEIIGQESKLFDLLTRSTSNTENPLEDINCIVFEYPLRVNMYDSNNTIIESQYINNVFDFRSYLNSIAPNQSISISYPMKTTLIDGTVKIINSNEELKTAIEACEDEQIIGYCEGYFCPEEKEVKTAWRINYKINANNNYVSGVFEPKKDKTLVFHYNRETLNGTWNFYRWNSETHINISLEGTSQTAIDWAIDGKCTTLGEIVIQDKNNKEIILKKNWDIVDHVFQIGDTGIGSGYVFYDKGYFSEGWRYLEVSREDLDVSEWGCSGTSISSATNFGIGQGYYNTAKITNFHDNLVNYYGNPSICNISNNGTVAAQKAILYISPNDYSDWYLPTKDELELIYQNLHSHSLGNFTNSVYWSSTEIDENNASARDFSDGKEVISPKIPTQNTLKIRAIRSF